MPRKNKKRVILDAAQTCIEKQGLENVTVRDITEEASVNVAAINYYFGSKNRLIEQALEEYIDNLIVEWEVILERRAMNFREGLHVLLQDILRQTLQHPRLMHAQISSSTALDEESAPSGNPFIKFLDFVLEHKKKATPSKSARIHQAELMHCFSAVLFPSLYTHLFDQFDQWDLQRREDRKAYVDIILKRLFS